MCIFHALDYPNEKLMFVWCNGWVWLFGIVPRANQRGLEAAKQTLMMCLSAASPSTRLAHSLITIRAISDHLHTKWSWQQVPVNLSKVLIWLLSDRHLRCNGGLSFDRMKKTDCSCVKYTPKSVFRKLSLSLDRFCFDDNIWWHIWNNIMINWSDSHLNVGDSLGKVSVP